MAKRKIKFDNPYALRRKQTSYLSLPRTAQARDSAHVFVRTHGLLSIQYVMALWDLQLVHRPPHRYALIHQPAISADARRDLMLQEVMVSLSGSMVIDPLSQLTSYAPPQIGRVDHPVHPTKVPVLGRKTITYQDADGVRHGATFDYLDIDDGWQLIRYISNIERTLDELNVEHAVKLYGKHYGALLNILDAPAQER